MLNVFRMLGMMRGDRLHVESSSAAPIQQIRDEGVRVAPDVYALAASADRQVSVLLWNYHDDDLPAHDAPVRLTIAGLPAGRPVVTHYRVDAEHSNAYELWKKAGSPQAPTKAQYDELEKAGRLQVLGTPAPAPIVDGRLALEFPLPRQAVSLLTVKY